MRPEGSPLDLNHLPDDFTRDGKQVYEDTSTSGQKKKKNKDGDGKVYECRFCSLKFCKSQALGERETETLNKARQLVYSSDNPPPLPHHHPHSHLGSSYVAPGPIYHQPPPPPCQVYPTRPLMFSGAPSSTVIQPPHHQYNQSFLYNTTPPRMLSSGDYYMAHGHALTSSAPTNYTCIGAPVGIPGLAGPPGGRDGLDHQDDALTSPY
ncbi:Zinc finger protein JAGGED [Bienertia sinuspersici]